MPLTLVGGQIAVPCGQRSDSLKEAYLLMVSIAIPLLKGYPLGYEE